MNNKPSEGTAGADGVIRRRAAGKARLFIALSASAAAIAALLFAIVTRLQILDQGFHMAFAMFLGVAGTVALAVALMALVFYSNRSGADGDI